MPSKENCTQKTFEFQENQRKVNVNNMFSYEKLLHIFVMILRLKKPFTSRCNKKIKRKITWMRERAAKLFADTNVCLPFHHIISGIRIVAATQKAGNETIFYSKSDSHRSLHYL
jgi:hypothetical protein